MITLSFDTATPAPSLALVRDGAVIGERSIGAQVGAGRRVAEEIHLLLGAARLDLDAVGRIVVGVGPGGFTGIRIGIATALGLGQALGIPVIGVSTLETLALGLADAHDDALVVPVIDARRNEVFTAAYRVHGGAIDEVAEARALPIPDAEAYLEGFDGPVVVAGDGVARLPEEVRASSDVMLDPGCDAVRSALAVRLADAGHGRPVTPVYLRLPDAEVNRRAREATTS